MNGRKGFRLAILAGVLAVGAIWSYTVMASARAKALEAKQGLEDVGRYALAIESYRQYPALVADRERLAEEMGGRIEASASGAGIGREKIARINQEEPSQRLGESAYKEKSTQVVLRGVTLEQAVRLTHAMCAEDSGLNVKSMRLTPSGEGAPVRWSADIVFTYLIYSPRSAGR